MKKRITYGVALVIVLLTLGLDQWTKVNVTRVLSLNESVEMIKNFFYIKYVQNTGAGFSMFAGAGTLFFSVITIFALVCMLVMFFKSEDRRTQLSLALVFSGAVGNFIDRLAFGYVRDFFSFYIFGYPFPVFNVADICITIGIVLLFIAMLVEDIRRRKNGTKSYQDR